MLETGSAVTMPWIDQVRGVIEAWYPGEQQGTALARLLWGDVNFTGKLPMTFPKSLADTPASTPQQYPGTVPAGSTIRQVDYSEGLAVGHKWYDSRNIEPLFPFGYGLSYTRFTSDHLKVTATGKPGDRTLEVTFRVRNTGSRAGAEASQVYLTLPGSTGEPGKRLVAFTRTSLAAGAARTVTLTVKERSADHPLSIWNSGRQRWQTVAGRYTVGVGSSSRAPAGTRTIRLG